VHVAVDGRARGVYFGPLALPAGPHHLRLDRAGFTPSERDVALRAGEETTLRITLDPTPETRLSHVERVQDRQRWGRLATAGGLALALGGAGLAIWSQQSLPELERRLDEAARNYSRDSGGDCDMATPLTDAMHAICQARYDDAAAQLSNRELLRTLSAVGAGVGLAAAAIGVYLLLTNDDARRYDRPASSASGSALTFVPSTWVHPGGAGAGLRVLF
jgi:hypothetical protein